MKILPVRKRLSKPLASVATFASRQGNYRFRLANVFASLFLPSRIFIIKQFFVKSILCLIFKKLEFGVIYKIIKKHRQTRKNPCLSVFICEFCIYIKN